MRIKLSLCVMAVAVLVVGCGSAERQANRSQAAVNEERLDLIEEYQECVEDADGNAEAVEACETLRKSAEALK